MRRTILGILVFLTASLFSLSAFAKSISLFEQPKDEAKVVGTINSDVGIIPIYTPEKSAWIKVADPRNGNVGWVKVKDLSGDSTQYTFTQRFINTGNAPQSYQIIQFGSPNKMTSEQIQTLLKQNQMQQQQIQNNINKTLQNMMEQMNTLYQGNKAGSGAPILMPVIVIPPQVLPAGNGKNAAPSDSSK